MSANQKDLKNPPLWKTTIVIWSEYDPTEGAEDADDELDIVTLAEEAVDGNAYCSYADATLIQRPEKDPHWDGTEFFLENDEEEEDENDDEDDVDLIHAYEEASGNRVVDDVVIVDSNGKYIGLFTEEMAEEYLSEGK